MIGPAVAAKIAEIPVAPDIIEAGRLPHVDRVGLGYLASYQRLGLDLRFDRLRESRGDLSAELTVLRFGSHQFRARVNLLSGTARSSTARYLDALPRPKDVERIDHREALEMAFLAILDRERQGEPFDIVGHRPTGRTADRRVLGRHIVQDRPQSIVAPGNTGKSTIARGMVASLELGVEVLPGMPPREQMRCLVLDWDTDDQEWNDGLARIAAGVGRELRPVLYRRCRRPLDEQVEKLSEVIAREGVGFVVIDHVEAASASRTTGESYEQRSDRLFAAVGELGPVTTLLLDHTSSDDVRNGSERIARKAIGSVMKLNKSRAAYVLAREPSPLPGRAEMVLHNIKLNDGPPLPPYSFAVLYDGDDGPIRFERTDLDSPELLRALSQPEQMRRHLRDGALGSQELAELLDVPPSTVRTILARDKGRRFVRLPDGRIGLVASDV
jgi:hypothetical protein